MINIKIKSWMWITVIWLVMLVVLVSTANADYWNTVNITGCDFKSAYVYTDEGIYDAGYCGRWETSFFEGNILVGHGYLKIPSNLNTSKMFYLNIKYTYAPASNIYNGVGTKINVISTQPDWINFTYSTRPSSTDSYGTSLKTIDFGGKPVTPTWYNYTINFINYGYGLHYYYTNPYLSYKAYPNMYRFTDNYISGYFYDPPSILSYSNTKTHSDSRNLSVLSTEFIKFNVTTNQTVTAWNWYKDNINQSNNFDNFTTNFNVGNHLISINATNANGTSNTVAWHIVSRIPSLTPTNVNIAVILAEPSDDLHNATHDKNYYLINIIPDLKDYYKEVSYGAINITINAEDVYDNNSNWYKLGKTAAHYGKNITKIDANGTTYEDGEDNSSQFRFDAVEAADSDVNFSNYDAVIVIHANKSQQEPGGNWDLMTTHAGIGDYNTSNRDIAKNLILNSEYEWMGTWAHEVGHTMGRILVPGKGKGSLPDRYGDRDGNHSIGDWDLMGTGNWLGNPAGSNPDHMSSFSKEWLEWLKYKSFGYGTYWINSLATMNYGDEITRYITKNVTGKNLLSYYIIEIRTNNPAYSKWDTSAPIPQGYNNTVVLYQVEESGKNSTVNYIANLLAGEGYWDSSYWDFASKVHFTALEERNRTGVTKPIFEIKVGIQNFSSSWIVGAILEHIDNLMGYRPPNIWSSSLNSEVPLPDLDLHAYTPDGKHVGVDYTTGAYENEILGANASGDLINGREWIFVPDNIKVQFVVDSKDNQKFLNSYPELQQITNGTQSYNLSIVYDVPDDIRYTTSVEQSIQPDEIWKYNYSIARNTDGTYSVEVDTIPPEIEKPLQAVVKIEPSTLNINSSGNWINAEIQVPKYNASLIDVTSIRLNGIIPVDIKSDEITEDDKEHAYGSKLKVKFNRTQVQNIVRLGNVTLYISGKVNGEAFMGSDTIRVIGSAKKEDKTKKQGS